MEESGICLNEIQDLNFTIHSLRQQYIKSHLTDPQGHSYFDHFVLSCKWVSINDYDILS
jgi:hypothetical protein